MDYGTLLSGPARSELRFWRLRAGSWSLHTHGEPTRAPRFSNATDFSDIHESVSVARRHAVYIKVVTKRDTENVAVKLSTIVLAIAFVTPSTLALAGPMNLADPVLVPSQSSTSHDHTAARQAGDGPFQRYPRLQQMVHAGRHSSQPHVEMGSNS